MTPADLSAHGADATRHYHLRGSFSIDGALIYYHRAPADREADIAPALESLACALEDDGWDLDRVDAPSLHRMPARLDYLRVRGRTLQDATRDPWDDIPWQARERRLRGEREERRGRGGPGPAPDAKREGALRRAIAEARAWMPVAAERERGERKEAEHG